MPMSIIPGPGPSGCVAPGCVAHVIDDDDAVRDALVSLLDSEGIAARPHVSASAFLDCLPQLERGCVVTDVRMPQMSGLELLREMQRRALDLPVIVLTGQGDVPMAVEALKNGATDFIEKPFDDETILAAVRGAMSCLGEADHAASSRSENVALLAKLTARENDVLEGLVAGQSNKVIAQVLGISYRTVEVYRANIMTKMKADSLSELVLKTFVAKGAGPAPPKPGEGLRP